MNLERLIASIRTIPDYPKTGVQFRDITTLLGDAEAFGHCITAMTEPYRAGGVDKVAGLEARGFIFGGAVAAELGVGFVPIRKKGKLPYRTARAEYTLEYGVDVLEVHLDAVKPGERVLIVDDLIATGGTAFAAIDVLNQLGAKIASASFVIDLPELGGAARLAKSGVTVHRLVSFKGH